MLEYCDSRHNKKMLTGLLSLALFKLWNGNIPTIFLSLAALEVVIMRTSRVTREENFVKRLSFRINVFATKTHSIYLCTAACLWFSKVLYLFIQCNYQFNGCVAMFPRSYVPRVLCCPAPMFPGSYVPPSYVPQYLCSPALMNGSERKKTTWYMFSFANETIINTVWKNKNKTKTRSVYSFMDNITIEKNSKSCTKLG